MSIFITHQNVTSNTHIDDFRHVIPSKLLIPEETLNTSDINQNKLTTFHKGEFGSIDIEIWRVDAVTLEKNVAIVVILIYRVVAPSFSSERNIGKTKHRCLRLSSVLRNQCGLASFSEILQFFCHITHSFFGATEQIFKCVFDNIFELLSFPKRACLQL